jgi:hypothetical protein
MDRKLSMEDAVGKAEESLRSGRGLNAFKKLIELQ